MPDWVLEQGIGEDRFVRIVEGEIVDARIHLEGTPSAGGVVAAHVTSVRPQVIAKAGTTEFLLPSGAAGASEGASIDIEVTREPIPGAEPWKRPLGRLAAEPRPTPGHHPKALPFPSPTDSLEEAGWSDLLDEARTGLVSFPAGQLRVSVTPAMTLIDVDGTLAPDGLARAAASAVARTIRRHCIGGSIGIDFPTVEGKALRTALGGLIDAGLERPFERTAVNGFGFLQIVRPRRHPSLFELAADRAPFEARALLRRAARCVGAATLTAHPAVIAAMRPQWIEALAAQVGGPVTLRPEPATSMSGGHVH